MLIRGRIPRSTAALRRGWGVGFGKKQMVELEATINAADCDLVLTGTPVDLGRLLGIGKPAIRVRHNMNEQAADELRPFVERVLVGQ